MDASNLSTPQASLLERHRTLVGDGMTVRCWFSADDRRHRRGRLKAPLHSHEQCDLSRPLLLSQTGVLQVSLE